MSEIPFKSLEKQIKQTPAGSFPQACLIYGEEFLYKNALKTMVDSLVPEDSRELNYEPMDGANENILKALEHVNTYSMIPGTKVVALRDAHIFYSKEDKDSLMEKAAKAAENNQLKKSSGFLLTLLNRLKLTLDDMEKDDRAKRLGVDAKTGLSWLDKVVAYCRDNSLNPDIQRDLADILVEAITRGFPRQNHLVITADMVDKRHRLYKAFVKEGWVVDCSIPKGERKADKVQQESALNEQMRAILSREGKSIRKDAYHEMKDMVGFNLRGFSNDLEKLVNYVGDRKEITVEDVRAVLKRTRKDPVFEFTNSVTDRNLVSSLYYLSAMLEAEMHPLQLIAAMANQVRRLINMKGFVESPQGSVWKKGLSYNFFQKQVLPALVEYDKQLSQRLSEWEARFSKKEEKKGKKKANKKAAPTSDLYLAPNPKNPYPIYQTLKKSDNFTSKELKDALDRLSQADIALKSTGQQPRRILENVLFRICYSKPAAR